VQALFLEPQLQADAQALVEHGRFAKQGKGTLAPIALLTGDDAVRVLGSTSEGTDGIHQAAVTFEKETRIPIGAVTVRLCQASLDQRQRTNAGKL